jgi:hypothetical protein
MTAILAAFLIVHGLLHLAIWLPRFDKDAAKPPPFRPDHSGVLTAVHAPEVATHRIAIALASTTATSYVAAGGFVALSMSGAATLVVAAAVLGIALKALYFHPWLIVGVLLDVLMLLVATTDWPLALA